MCTWRPQLGPVFVAFLPPRRLSGPRGQFSRARGGCWGSGQVGQDTRVKVLNLYLERKKLTQGLLCDGEITSWTVSTGEVKTGGQYMWENLKLCQFCQIQAVCVQFSLKGPKKCDLTTTFWTFCDLWCEDRLMDLACSSHA